MRQIKIVLCCFAIINLWACPDVDSDVDKAVHAIDLAITQLERTSVGWQNIITKLGNDLPKEAHDLIANDVDMLAKDVIGATTESVMCTMDFVKTRAIQTLKNLKARLLKQALQSVTPGFCTLTIASVDLNDSNSMKTLNIYGFDLNSRDKNNNPIQVFLIGKDTQRKIDESLIGRTTNYQLAINLAVLVPQLTKNEFSKIKLFWNGESTNMPEVLIQPWKAAVVPEIVKAQTLEFFPPHIGAGDFDFDTSPGNWTDGSVHMEYQIDPSRTTISARIYMQAMEFGGDNTQVKGVSPWHIIYTVPTSGYQILDFTPLSPSEVLFSFREQGSKDFHPGGTISSYAIQIDQKGPDAGYTKVTAYLDEFTVTKIQKRPGQ